MDKSKTYPKFLSQLIADKFFIYGNHTKDSLTFHGISEKSLITTGCGRYDVLFNESKNTEGKYILLMSSGMPSRAFSYFLSNEVILEWEKMFESVFLALKELDEKIIIKRHPTQKEVIDFKGMAEKFLPNVKIYKNKNTYELLSNAKLVISPLSSVLAEAIILDKPIVMPRHIKHDFGPPHEATNAVRTIDNPNESLTAIKEALYDEKIKLKLKKGRDEFLKKNFEYQGSSTKKTIRTIDEILKNDNF